MRKFYIILVVVLNAFIARADLQINEIMQSNIDRVLDDLNDFPDSWVELYNSGSSAVNLADYALGLTPLAEDAYVLPEHTLAAGDFILIYCDKVGKSFHTPFRLDTGKGGAVYLFKNGKEADAVVNISKMPTPNVAQGRLNEKSDEWGFLVKPTPSAANCGVFATDILPEPIFSHSGSVNPKPFDLDITVPDECPGKTVIRYTLDCSEPTESSPIWNGKLYVDSTLVVKAKLFCDSYLSPFSTTHSYIFLDRNATLPVVSISTDSLYLYGDKLGITVAGTYHPKNKNFEYKWRRPINIEFFETEQSPSVINQLCETRIKGQSSRYVPLQSLALYAHKRFGNKRFTHEFFPDDAPGLTDWTSLELRNSGNDFYYLYFRDALMQYSVAKNVDVDYQFYRPTILIMNGEYKGIINLRSRTNEDLIYTTYNGLEDIDVIEKNVELKAGSMEKFDEFKAFYSSSDHTLDDYRRYIDVDEYTNMMLTHILYDNKDFPGNNIICWRPRTDDGRWRWILKDTDTGLGLNDTPSDFKIFNWLYDPNFDSYFNWANKPEHTLLFRQLLDILEYKSLFIDKCAIYLGDFMSVKSVLDRMHSMYGVIKQELPHHRKLYNKEEYSLNIDRVTNWYTNHVPFLYGHLAEFFNLGKPVPVRINKGEETGYTIVVNGIELATGQFDGQYFHGMTLNIASNDVPRWYCRMNAGNGSYIDTEYFGDFSLEIPDNVTEIVISSEGWPASVKYVTSDSETVRVFDIKGRFCGEFNDYQTAVDVLDRGMYIFRQESHTFKCVLQ